MVPQKLLSYQASQSVIKVLNAGIRTELHRTCPSLRFLENLIPLKIHNLQLEPFCVTLDGISFNIGAVKYRKLTKPEERTKISSEAYKKLRNSVIEVFPGDVLIRAPVHRFTRIGARDITDLRMDLADMEFADNSAENQVIREKLRFQLLPYELPTVGPISYRIQLTVKGLNGSISHEVMEYENNFHAAMRYLIAKIFLRRAVEVDHLTIKLPEACENTCFRLPPKLKLKIRKFTSSHFTRTVFSQFAANIDESSYPLKQFGYFEKQFVNASEIPQLLNAKKLVAHGWITSKEITLTAHKRVHFSHVHHANGAFFKEIVRIWIKHPRAVGTHFSFNLDSERSGKILLTYFENHPKAVVGALRTSQFQKCVIFVISSDAELAIYCKNDVVEEEGKFTKYPTIHFKVRRKGSVSRLI